MRGDLKVLKQPMRVDIPETKGWWWQDDVLGSGHDWPWLITFPIRTLLSHRISSKVTSACSHLTMISSRVKKSSPDAGNNTPITIQVQVTLWRMSAWYSSNPNIQVPGAQDGSAANSPLLPQQDCPAFAGDAVLNGAFKKISNAVDQNTYTYKKSWE